MRQITHGHVSSPKMLMKTSLWYEADDQFLPTNMGQAFHPNLFSAYDE